MSTPASASAAAAISVSAPTCPPPYSCPIPQSYDGGELVVETSFGEQRVRLAAGDMVLYPASSLHRVEPVTRGVRLASFFWVQSMIRDDGARHTLFDLDRGIQDAGAKLGQDDPSIVALTGVYHNLLRRWAEL